MVVGRRIRRGHRVGAAANVLGVKDMDLVPIGGLWLGDRVGISVAGSVADGDRLRGGGHAHEGDDQVPRGIDGSKPDRKGLNAQALCRIGLDQSYTAAPAADDSDAECHRRGL